MELVVYSAKDEKEVLKRITVSFPKKLVDIPKGSIQPEFSLMKLCEKKATESDVVKLSVSCVNILPWMTLEEVKYVIATLFRLEYSNILRVEKIGVKFVGKNNADVYDNMMSVGYSTCIFHCLHQSYDTNVSYDYKFMPNYRLLHKYISSLPSVSSESIMKSKICQNVEVMLTWGDDSLRSCDESHSPHDSSNDGGDDSGHEVTENDSSHDGDKDGGEVRGDVSGGALPTKQQVFIFKNLYEKSSKNTPIDIVKLFNMTKVSQNIKKITIHDNVFTEYNNEDRETQYVKTFEGISEPFKNTFSRFNCCVIYTSSEVFPSIMLSRIEFYNCGMIKCCFMITDPEMTFEDIDAKLQQYFSKDGSDKRGGKFWQTLEKTHVDECIYDDSFTIFSLQPSYGQFSFIYNVDDTDKDVSVSLDKFSVISNQTVPHTVYKTNTSIFISGYSMDSSSVRKHHAYTKTFRPMVTEITLRLDVMSHIHVQCLDDNNAVIYFTKIYTWDDLVMNAALVLPLFSEKCWNKNEEKNVKQKPGSVLPDEVLLEKIRKKYQKIPTKKGIKKLNEIDPILFGTRVINERDVRPYSALAQKKEQRVVSITRHEYDVIRRINNEYAANVKNQSQSSQRLYLFCPWEVYPFLNYHHYHNQLCIPKCTTNITKRTQYIYCANQLEAKDYSTTFDGDSSKMIVYYTPLLLEGRKCFPPDELSVICENYLLTKYSGNINIAKLTMDKYGCLPFIILRDNVSKKYIIQTELVMNEEENNKYMLVIQSELDHGYFLVIDDEDQPFIIHEHEEFMKFVLSIQREHNEGNSVFDFIQDIFPKTRIPPNTTFINAIKILQDMKVKFVVNPFKEYIIGVIVGGHYLSIPPIKNISGVDTMSIGTVISAVGTSFKLPPLDLFNERFITKYFVEYTPTHSGHGSTKNGGKEVDKDVTTSSPTHSPESLGKDSPAPLANDGGKDSPHNSGHEVNGSDKNNGGDEMGSDSFQGGMKPLRRICAIEYKGIIELVNPVREDAVESFDKPFILFDYHGYLEYFARISSKRIFVKNIQDSQQDNIIKKIIAMHIFIGTISGQTMKKHFADETKIVFYDNILSWKNSKISEKDYTRVWNKYFAHLSNIELIDIVYGILNDNMTVDDNDIIFSKIITNNTM